MEQRKKSFSWPTNSSISCSDGAHPAFGFGATPVSSNGGFRTTPAPVSPHFGNNPFASTDFGPTPGGFGAPPAPSGFRLQLVNAETREPLKEFTASDGKVYVEAEPDLEYYIRCYSARGVREGLKTLVALEVDGTYLGYDQPFSTETGDMGLWKQQNCVTTFRALKLILKKRNRGAARFSSFPNATPAVGSVKATFYEITYYDEMVVPVLDHDATNCLDINQSSTVESGAKKAFTSVSGSAIRTTSNSKWRRPYRRGRHLGEITIHYTSALGLSQLGILPPIVPATPATRDLAASDLPERKRRRVNTEPARRRVVTPRCPHCRCNNSMDVIDLTGDD